MQAVILCLQQQFLYFKCVSHTLFLIQEIYKIIHFRSHQFAKRTVEKLHFFTVHRIFTLQKRLYIQYMHHMLKQFIVSLYLQ